MNDVFGRIHSVETFGALDGPGIRYVLFLQGCPLKCLYCHNPDSWSVPAGREVSARAAFEDILKYRSFIRSGGITLSGGEPLLQPAFCTEIIRLCHETGIHTALDTAGGVPLSACREAVDAADLILLDLKAADDDLYRTISGSSGLRARELLDYLEETGKPVWIRHVVVPGLTLEDDALARLAQYIRGFSCVQRVELLPFHKMGEYKWKELDIPYALYDCPSPTSLEMAHVREIFAAHGVAVYTA